MVKQSDKIQAQIEALQQRRSDALRKERATERKVETKRKILLGSMLLYRLDDGHTVTISSPRGESHVIRSVADLMGIMDVFLTRPADRKAFGLSVENDASRSSSSTQGKSADVPVTDKGASTPSDNVVTLHQETKTAASAAMIDGHAGEADGNDDFPKRKKRLAQSHVSNEAFFGLDG